MFMNFADVLSVVGFIGFGACLLGACIDYCDWLVIAVLAFYLVFAIAMKIWSVKMYRREVRRKALEKDSE